MMNQMPSKELSEVSEAKELSEVSEAKELSEDMKNLLRSINECCMKINEEKGLNCKFKRIEFLEKEGFYDK